MVENPQAFPRPIAVNPDNGKVSWEQAGMTLRDYFAGECCKGGADAICDNLSEDGEEKALEHAARHAKAAYMVADAMLVERAKESR